MTPCDRGALLSSANDASESVGFLIFFLNRREKSFEPLHTIGLFFHMLWYLCVVLFKIV